MVHEPGVQGDDDFQTQASQKRTGFLGELVRFAMQERKWWLVPLIVVLLGVGLILVLAGTAAGPFIYALF